MILKIKTRLIIEPVRRSLGETVKWLRWKVMGSSPGNSLCKRTG